MNKLLLTIALAMPLVANAKTSLLSQPISATKGYIYTDKGTPIEVYKLDMGPGMPPKVNNSGWTFGDGQFWIENSQVPTILKDE